MKNIIAEDRPALVRNTSPIRWQEVVAVPLLTFLVSALLFSLRNLDPLLFPTIYAEDGKWAGSVLTDGTLHTAFHAREFPVLGLVGLLRVGLVAVELFFGGDLSWLPLVYFIVSTLFLATTATLAFCAFQGELPISARLALWCAIVLMPVGDDANEIFGRILNIGFVFPVLQYLLLAKCLREPRRIFWVLVAVFFSLVAGWTFPVCIGVSGAAMLVFLFSVRSQFSDARPYKTVAAILAGVLVLNVLFLSANAFLSKGGADLPFSANGVIEFAFARALLYPLVAAWYGKMTDLMIMVLALVVVLFVVVGASIAISRNSGRAQLLLLIMVFSGYYLATILMRSGFTSIYGEYKTTFPDRYYYGLNALFVFLVVLVSEKFRQVMRPSGRYLKMTVRFVPVVMIATLLACLPRQFELGRPKMHWAGIGTLEYSMCAFVWGKSPLPFDHNAKRVELPIYPLWPGYVWRMTLPVERLYRFDKARCESVFSDTKKQPRIP